MDKKEIRDKLVFNIVILALLTISIFLKASFISAKELWLDETYSSYLASQSFSNVISFVKGDVHPPLYYISLKGWSVLFGLSPVSLRSFSIIANVLASLLFYYLVSKVFSRRIVQLFCFSLFLFSPVLFWYSVEVRMYMFTIVIIILSLIYFNKIISSDNVSKLDIFLFSLFSAGVFYVDYFATFLLMCYCIYFAQALFRKKIHVKAVAASAMLFLILTLPWYSTVYEQGIHRIKFGNDLKAARLDPNTLSYGYHQIQDGPFLKDASDISQNMASIMGVYPLDNKVFTIIIALPFIVTAFYSVSPFAKKDKFTIITYILVMVYFLLFSFLHITARRFLISLTPLFILLIGASLNDMAEKKNLKQVPIIIGVIILFFYVAGTVRIYDKNYCRPTMELVKLVKENYQPDDVVVFHSLYSQVPFDYYASSMNFHPSRRGFPINISEWWNKQPYKAWSGPVIAQKELAQFVEDLRSDKKIKSVWLILFETNLYDPNNKLLSMLQGISPSSYEYNIDYAGCLDKADNESHYKIFKIAMN
jgi:uncharacterized membrane protein